MSKLSDKRYRKDRFHNEARNQGFRARSVFKLEEIDNKVGLFRPGARVLDLGCAPGSWVQYAAKRIGSNGAVVGIDRVEIPALPGFRQVVGNIYEVPMQELLGDLSHFDVVMSDMAPDTTGIRHVDQARSEELFSKALEIAVATLAHGGHFVAKLFQGPDFKKLIDETRKSFREVKVIKPQGSRSESIEQYVVGLGRK